MRKGLLILAVVLVAGCQPNLEEVIRQAQAKLQQRIDAEDSLRGGVTVASVEAVKDNGNRYRGDAHITAYGSPSTLKVSVLADDKTVIIDIDDKDWLAFEFAANKARLSPLSESVYSNIVVNNEDIKSMFSPALLRNWARFTANMDTIHPVTHKDRYWLGTGCRAHECGSHDSAWLIDVATMKAYAVVMDESDDENSAHYSVYGIGGQDVATLPEPLIDWALDHRIPITRENSVAVLDTPPPTN